MAFICAVGGTNEQRGREDQGCRDSGHRITSQQGFSSNALIEVGFAIYSALTEPVYASYGMLYLPLMTLAFYFYVLQKVTISSVVVCTHCASIVWETVALCKLPPISPCGTNEKEYGKNAGKERVREGRGRKHRPRRVAYERCARAVLISASTDRWKLCSFLRRRSALV